MKERQSQYKSLRKRESLIAVDTSLQFRSAQVFTSRLPNILDENIAQDCVIELLPQRSLADHAMQQYFKAVHPVAQVLHKPTFDIMYQDFWTSIEMGITPEFTVQAILFAVLFSGILTMESEMRSALSINEDLVSRLQKGTEVSLRRAKYLSTRNLQTLQALVIYMVCIYLLQYRSKLTHTK